MGTRSVELKIKLTPDAVDADKVMARIRKEISSLGDEFALDPKGLKLFLSDLNEAAAAMRVVSADADEISSAMRLAGSEGAGKLTDSLLASRSALAGLMGVQTESLGLLRQAGQEGSAEYASITEELARNQSELRKLDKTIEEVAATAKKAELDKALKVNPPAPVELRVNVEGDESIAALATKLRNDLGDLEGVSIQIDADGVSAFVQDVQAGEAALQSLATAAGSLNVEIKTETAADMAARIDAAKKSLEELSVTQAKALAQMKLTGRDGTAAFAELEAELKGTLAKLQDVDSALGAVAAGTRRVGDGGIDDLAGDLDSTKKGLEEVIDAQRRALAQLHLTGQAGTDGYEKLRLELKKNVAELKNIDGALNQVAQEADKSGGILEKALAFDAIGKAGEKLSALGEKMGGVVKATQKAAGQNPDLDEAGLEALGRAGGAAYAAGFGESVGDGFAAASAVQRNIGKLIPKDSVDEAAVFAGSLAQTWEEDVNDLVGKSTPLFKQFNLEVKEGFDLVAFAKANLANADDDSLDTIKEYSVQFKQMGLGAAESMGLLERGLDAGAFNTDKLADGIKEAFLRITSAGDDATKALDEVTGAPVELIAKLKTAIAEARSGKISVADALRSTAGDIQNAVDSKQIGDVVKKQLEIAIGNTPLEDVGAGMFTTLFSAPIDTADIERRAAVAGEAVQKSIAPANLWESITRGAESAFSDVSGAVGPIVAPLGSALTTVSSFGPALSLLDDKFSIFDKAGDLLKGKFLPSLLSLIPGMGAQAVATAGATTAQTGLNLAMLANPAFLLVAGIGAVVAAFLIFGRSTQDVIDGVTSATEDAKAAMTSAQQTFEQTSAADDEQKRIAALADEYDRLKNSTAPDDQARFKEVAAELAATVPQATQAVDDFNKAGAETSDTYSINTDVVRKYTEAQLAQNQALRDAAIAETQQKMRELAGSTAEARDEMADLRETQKEYQNAFAKGQKFVDTGFFSGWEDTRDALDEVTKNIGALEDASIEANDQFKEGVKFLTQQGLSVQEIADQTDLTVEEVQQYKISIEAAEKAAKKQADATGDVKNQAAGAATATGGLAASAQRAKANAESLAAAYQKVKQAADGAYNSAFGATRALQEEQRNLQSELRNLQSLGASLTEEQSKRVAFIQERLAALPGLIEEEKKAARDALREQKRLELEETQLSIQIGAIKVNTEDFGPQAEEVMQEVNNLLFGIANENVRDEVQKQINQINQDLAQSLADIDKNITEAKKQAALAAADPTSRVKNLDQYIRAEGALRQALEAKAQSEIARLQLQGQQQQLDQLRELLTNKQALIDAAVDRRIAALEREEARIRVVDEDSAAQRLRARLEIIDLQRAKEATALLAANDLYIRAMGGVQKAQRDIGAALTAEERSRAEAALVAARQQVAAVRSAVIGGDQAVLDTLIANDAEMKRLTDLRAKAAEDLAKASTDADRVQAQSRVDTADRQIETQRKYLANLRATTLASHADLTALNANYDAQEVEAEKASASELYAIRVEELDRQLAAEERRLQKRLELQAAFLDQLVGLAQTLDDDSITAKTEEQMQGIERLRDNELISLEKFEAEKTRITEEAEKARLVTEARIRGLRLAEDAAELEQQKKSIERRRELAELYGQHDEVKKLSIELDEVSQLLKEKGDVLTQTLGILQEGTTEALGNVFADAEGAMKQPLKKVLATMGSYLQRLISGKVIEVILGSIPAGSGFIGALAAFALKPIIESAFTSLASVALQGMLSFASGGRVDSPTLAVVGDGARLGGPNREWIFTDDQLRQVMDEVVGRMAALIVGEIRGMRQDFRDFAGRLHVSARDVYERTNQYAAKVNQRVVYRMAA